MRLQMALVPLMFLALGSSHAQRVTADLEGVVRDEQGRVLPGAILVIHNGDTGLERTIVTDTSGRYLVRGFPVEGEYKITVEYAGFATAVQQHLTLPPNQTRVIDFTVQVGTVADYMTRTVTLCSGASPVLVTVNV